MANVVGFNEVDFDDDMDLLISEKEQLSNEDLIELEKESREEAEEEVTEEVDGVLAHNQKLSDALQITNKARSFSQRRSKHRKKF